MTVETTLLVTDDPDDHYAFTEAFAELSANAVVLIVLDSQKAITLLKNKRHKPDYIFLDLSMHGVRVNTFLSTIRADDELASIPTIIYGDQEDLKKVEGRERLLFFNKQYDYSELRAFLHDVRNNH